ncbi:hypothetical protein [Microbacterium sp. H83]|uniref:hypothetical protein n=1 Tax=Microbacterium sp. H83 TaxID=1827324 RepID=UPI0007F348AD|nr:hypothetical protein [Microbacterium sp. H83]OAN35304.1 hypothetical protein A4X16_05390 [Microbacterium sp. H83]
MNDAQIWTMIGAFTALMLGMLTVVSTLFVRVVRAEIGGLRGEMNAQIGGLRGEMNARFEAVDARFDAVDARFDAVNTRIDALDRDVQAVVDRSFRRERD